MPNPMRRNFKRSMYPNTANIRREAEVVSGTGRGETSELNLKVKTGIITAVREQPIQGAHALI